MSDIANRRPDPEWGWQYVFPQAKRWVTGGLCTKTQNADWRSQISAQRIHVLRNRVVNTWAGRENEIPNPPPPPAIIGQSRLMPNSVPGGVPYDMPKFSAMLPTTDTTGDFEEMCMPAGAGVKSIKEIRPAAEIVVEIMEEARLILENEML